jgi:hypothetical protein
MRGLWLVDLQQLVGETLEIDAPIRVRERGGQGELGQGCPQAWTEGLMPPRNDHSRDPRAAGKKARRGRDYRVPELKARHRHATTIADACGFTRPIGAMDWRLLPWLRRTA